MPITIVSRLNVDVSSTYLIAYLEALWPFRAPNELNVNPIATNIYRPSPTHHMHVKLQKLPIGLKTRSMTRVSRGPPTHTTNI